MTNPQEVDDTPKEKGQQESVQAQEASNPAITVAAVPMSPGAQNSISVPAVGASSTPAPEGQTLTRTANPAEHKFLARAEVFKGHGGEFYVNTSTSTADFAQHVTPDIGGGMVSSEIFLTNT